jgi:hypothetical protein
MSAGTRTKRKVEQHDDESGNENDNGAIERFDANQVSNGAERIIEHSEPYIASFEITGVAPILLHGWNSEAVDAKGKAAKGSKGKKEDDLESYIFRTPDGHIGVPSLYIVSALSDAGRSMQDPRSPRKSMRDLLRAILIPLPAADSVTPFLPKTKTWEYLHRGRVVIQRNAITRSRPAFKEGWRLAFEVLVNSPEYCSPSKLAELIGTCGRLNGFCDFRPSYGRFVLSRFDTRKGT